MNSIKIRGNSIRAILESPLLLLLVFLFCLVLILAFRINVTGYAIASDGLGYYTHLRSAFIDGDLHYENEITATIINEYLA